VYRDLRNQLAKFVAAEANAPAPPTGRGQAEAWAEWLSRHDVPLDRVNVVFCHEWEQTLRATGIKEITLSLRFRTLRAVLNQAIAAGLVKPAAYPFARTVAEKHKLQVGKFDVSTGKRAISRDELRNLEAQMPSTDRQQLAKDVFLFSFYCGGINFVDLAQLRWCDLSGVSADTGHPARLNYVRQKTGGKFTLRLLAPAAAIVGKYRPFTYATSASYVFPALDAARHLTPHQVKNRLHKVLGQVNKDLKELGQLAGIITPLTTYVARHTFATTLKQAGTNTAVISQAMGHKSESCYGRLLGFLCF
jgi:integrase